MSEETTSPGDKPYDPTPARLEEARKKGEIVRSADLNTAISYSGALLVLAVFGAFIIDRMGRTLTSLIDRAPELSDQFLAPGGHSLAGGLVITILSGVALFMLVPGALVILSLFAQRAILFTPSKLAPKLSRISPLSNAKNKFGSNGLFEFAKAAAKLMIYSGVLAWMLWSRRERILTSLFGSPGQISAGLGQLVLEFLMAVCAVALVLALIDYFWQTAQHLKKHRMSHKELMDEAKTREGDPHMKSKRRQRGQEIALNKMLSDIPDADVVIVNPTHYAVVLTWDRDAGQVPVCVAKGVDEIAARIREVAAQSGIPIYSDPPTARLLFSALEIGQGIAPDHYRAVAAAIRFADRMRQIVGQKI